MSQKTLACLFGLAILNPPLSAQDAEPAPFQLVTLIDIAEIEFEPSTERIEDWNAWPGSWETDFFLVTDEAGAPIYCEPFDVTRQSPLSDRLCADLLANARLAIYEGFSLGGRQGVVALSKEPISVLPGITLPDGSTPSPVRLSIMEMAPEAFTQYEPLRPFELVETEGLKAFTPEAKPAYPQQSFRERHEGSTGTVVGVSAEGETTSCRPIESSGYGRLDSYACRFVLEHLRFDVSEVSPDAEAPYYYRTLVTFRMDD